MAVNEIGAKIKLEGEAKYREEMRQITQQTKLMREETARMETQWGKDASAKQKAEQQTKLLNQQIKQQKQAVQTAKENVEKYAQETGKGSSETLKWKNALVQAENELARLEKELKEVPNSIQLVGQKMEAAGQKIKSIGDGISNIGKTLTASVTAPIVGLAAAAVKTTADFDESMSKVMALSGATGTEFEALRNKAREMGSTTKYSASEAADAMSYMALAGWDADQMIDGLDGVLNLAAASGMDLATASDIVTDYLSAFGLEAADASTMADELAYAQANSNTTTQQLGDAFGNSAAQMHTAGQTMETTTALLEAFANQGLKGSEAGTALSAMVRDMTQKMKNGKIMIGDTAVQVMDANGNFRDMTDILADVEAATDGMGTAEKTAALQMTFTARSIKGVSMILTEGSDSVKAYRDELYGASGTAEEMAKIMQDNLKGELVKLKSAVQELGISFGEILVPKVRKAVEWLQKQVDKFSDLDEGTKEMIVKFGLLAAAIGPVLTVGGQLVSSFGSVVEFGGRLVSKIGELTGIGGFAGMTSVAGPAAVAVGAIAGAALLTHQALNKVKESARQSNEKLFEAVDAANAATEAMKQSGSELKGAYDDANESISDTLETCEKADFLVQQLEDLSKAHRLTTDEQTKQKAIVKELNEIYPELGLTIDDTTGKLNMSVKAIKDYVTEASKTAQIQVYMDALTEVTEKLNQAELDLSYSEYEVKQAQNEVAGSQAEAIVQAKKRLQSGEKLSAWEAFEIGQILSHASAYSEESAAAAEVTEAMWNQQQAGEELNGTIDECKTYQEYLIKSLRDLGIEVTDDGVILGEMAEQVGNTGELVKGLGGDVKEAAESIGASTDEIIEAFYETAKAAKDSVMDTKNAFSEFQKPETLSAEQILANLRSQAEGYRNYNQNIKTLMNDTRYGVDEAYTAMVNDVAAHGIEMAGEAQGLVDALDDDGMIEQIVHEWNVELGGELDEYADNVARAKTITEYGVDATIETLESGVRGITKSGRKIGVSATEGIASGMGEGNKKVSKEADKAAHKATLDENRTARKAVRGNESTGRKATEAMADGMEKGNKQVDAQASSAAKKATLDEKKCSGTITTNKATGKKITQSAGEGMAEGNKTIVKSGQQLESHVKNTIVKVGSMKPQAQAAGKGISDSTGTGVSKGNPTVKTQVDAMHRMISNGITGVKNLGPSALSAAKTVGTNTYTGIKTTLPGISTNAGSMKTMIANNINAIRQLPAKVAAQTVGGGLATGLANKKSSVSQNSNALKTFISNSVVAIRNMKGTALAAAQGTAGGIATGIANKKPAVSQYSSALKTFMSNSIVAIRNMKNTAISAAQGTTGGVATGIAKKNPEVSKNANTMKMTVKNRLLEIRDMKGTAKAASEGTAGAVATGMANKQSLISKNATTMYNKIKSMLVTNVKNLKGSAQSGAESAAGGLATGLKNKKTVVDQTSEALFGAVNSKVSDAVKNWKSQTITAGESAAGGLATGISNKKPAVDTEVGNVTKSAKSMGDTVSGYTQGNETAGSSAAGGIATGISKQKDTVGEAAQDIVDEAGNMSQVTTHDSESWGSTLASNLATGISGGTSGVSGAVTGIVSEAGNVSKVKEHDTYNWGAEMVNNLTYGMQAAMDGVISTAQAVADNIRARLHFTHPDIGPLKEGTEIWGRHMVQEYAKGMKGGMPALRSAVDDVAYAAAAIPTHTMLNIDAVSGRNTAESLTLDGLFSVISAALTSQETVLQIGDREFGRILREHGAIA